MGKKGGPREKDMEEAKSKPAHHYMDGGVPGVKMANRSCTDKLMLLLFIIMLIVMVYIQGWAFGNGDLEKVAAKFDMEGQNCTGDYPNKLFTRLLPRAPWGTAEEIANGNGGGIAKPDPLTTYYSVCVSKCPTEGNMEFKFLPNKQYPANSSEITSWNYQMGVVMGYCVPDVDVVYDIAEVMTAAEQDSQNSEIMEKFNEAVGAFNKYIADIEMSVWLIVLMSFVALLVTLIYFFLLKWITKPILYTSLFLIFLLGVLITYWFYLRM